MDVDLVGWVERADLPVSRPLQPVFEAVSNALDAIDEVPGLASPYVRIEVRRSPTLDTTELGPIESFVVSDNGIGFNDINFRAFKTAATTKKMSRGGKGMGRLSWLNAFARVRVESWFDQNGTLQPRFFSFSTADVQPLAVAEDAKANRGSTVILEGFRENLASRCKGDSNSIARAVLEHFLPAVIDEKCPAIELCDTGPPINLRSFFLELFPENELERPFQVKAEKFDVIVLRLRRSATGGRHRLAFTAGRRVVLQEKLDTHIADLASGPLTAPNGSAFFVVAYVRGQLLDRRVSPDRLRFALGDLNPTLEDAPTDLFDEPTLDEVRRAAVTVILDVVQPFLEEVADEKRRQVERFIDTEAPQYRVLKSELAQILPRIKPGLRYKDLDLILHQELSDRRLRLKQQGATVEGELDKPESTPEYRQRLKEFLQAESNFALSDLVNYVLHRRTVLKILALSLQRNPDTGSFRREDALHSIVFPMRLTSDDVDYERHNLWVIDERLSYHHHLSSDRLLKSIPFLETSSERRPDIVVFNGPIAYGDGNDLLAGIVIVEFKRPRRAQFGRDDPTEQVIDQLLDIREGKWTNSGGRTIDPASRNAPAALYVVCDIEPQMERFIVKRGLRQTPDGRGWSGVFGEPLSCTLEILTYDKLVQDARKRNRVFFEKLGLPPGE
jgi:hypothetical protein